MNIRIAPPAALPVKLYDILGASVAAIGWDEAIGLLRRLVVERRFTKVGFLNAHNSNIAAADPQLARAFDDFLVLPDGFGIDIAAKLLYGETFPANLNGTDFIPAFLQAVREPLSIGLLGTTRDNAARAAAALAVMVPQHRVFVVSDGFFGPEDEVAILDRLAADRPDVLLIAMGTPRQELWMEKLGPKHCTLPIGVGALLDFLSGAIPRAPMWMRRTRLEWLFRLSHEPHRLWKRYVIGNPIFLARVIRQKFSGNAPGGRFLDGVSREAEPWRK